MGDLDVGKLTSVDDNGDHLSIIPGEVRGFYRKHRNWSQIVLLFIFLAIPWTTFNGHQTVLINIPERDFALFGLVFKAHDVPLLFFILGVLALGLAFVTSIWGRVWCGWACPQTVFIDAVFRRIEILIEGTYLKRRKLRDSPMNLEKFTRGSLKWVLFTIVSSIIAHSFMAYFLGAKTLIEMIQNSPTQNSSYFLLVSFFTALILFDFGWFREQFCVIMCPYGRIQSVLLDSQSLAIIYDGKRGEPRRSLKPAPTATGDCVACNRCVQVCPTGIDIRNGLQMECIACTACADACDEIMEKVNKPKGLIRYDTLDGSKINLFKPRSLIYIFAILGLCGGLAYALVTREPAHFTILRGTGLPYSFVKNDSGQELVLNQFRVHIQNQGTEPAEYLLSLPTELTNLGIQFTVAENPLRLLPGESREWYFFVRIPPSLISSGQLKTELRIKDLLHENSFNTSRELILLGPQSP